MIGKTILHYPPKADQPLADKILEKLGEVLLRSSLHTEVDKTKVCFVGHGGPVRRFILHNFSEGGSIYINGEVYNDR
jgi:hypothetical protein